jgi:hypothetical protein
MANKTFIRTGRKEFDGLIPLISAFLANDVLETMVDGKLVSGFRTPDAKSIWIRDHSDMLRAGRYFANDVTTVIDHFAETQSATGRIFDYFSTFPEKPSSERENWTKYVRVPVEADVEYRFVKAAYLAWQATGDDEWMRRLLPHMELALDYILNHHWYWDTERGLVKRAYTIDTWDFAYTAGAHDWLQFQIDENTYWGIMHGDNSGYYEAFRILATLYDRFGDAVRSAKWAQRARTIRDSMNELCWNGSFYTHFVKTSDVEIAGVDEASQLSLSNPMAINRGVTTHQMATSIINEYMRRRVRTDAFAEWFSIDPPFPDGIFGDAKLVGGAYVNGGIMPLVGGELAKAAFEHGFEEYGVDILRRYHQMISKSGETYLWYFPDGAHATVETSTSPDAEPTDGWGSSAMLWALVTGLAGVEDLGKGFDAVRLAPRWHAAEITDAQVHTTYQCSGKGFGYDYRCRDDGIDLVIINSGANVSLHILTPAGSAVKSVTVDGAATPFQTDTVESSQYVDFSARVKGEVGVRVDFSRTS